MPYLIVLVFALLASSVFASGKEEISHIKQLQWQNRVLIIWSEQPRENLQSLLDNFGAEIDDRDIAVFILNEESFVSNYRDQVGAEFLAHLKNRFPLKEVTWYLVGKDGGVKNKGSQLTLSEVFDQIDRMPMRIQEMKNRAEP